MNLQENWNNWNSRQKQIYGGGTVAVAVLLSAFAFSGDEKPKILQLPLLPIVSNTFDDHHSGVDNGKKIKISNTANNAITIRIMTANDFYASGRISAGESKEFGWLENTEGRSLKTGEVITFHSDGYQDWEYTVE